MKVIAGDVEVRIGADDAGLSRGLKRADKAVAGFSSRAKSLIGVATKIQAVMAAVGASVGVALVSRANAAIDAQAKLAQTLGTTSASLATLTRAGDLSGVSMSSVEQATKDLARRLSQAAGDTGPAVDALKRLGLTAQELMGMPLDERIATINQAILDFIPAAERAAVAGQLFGEEGSLAMQRIDPGSIAEAKRQIEGMGLALSEVDAAKVERANDALSGARLAMQGFINQIAVKVAPVVAAIATHFQEAAIEAGGFSAETSRLFSFITKGAGVVADAVTEIGVRFLQDGRTILQVAKTVQSAIEVMLKAIKWLIKESIREWNSMLQAFNAIPIVPDIPLLKGPGDGLVNSWSAWGDDLDGMLTNIDGKLKGLEEGGKPSEKLNEWLASVTAEADALAQSVATAREDLRTLETGEEVSSSGGGDKKDASKGGAVSRVKSMQDQITEMVRKAAAERTKILEQEKREQEAVYGGLMDNLATLANTGNKKMFKIYKAASIAQAILKARESTTAAWAAGMKVGGPVLAAAFAASSIAATAAQIASLKSTSDSSSSLSGSSSGRSAGRATTAAAPAPAQEPLLVRLDTLLPSSLLSGRMISDLFDQLNKEAGARGVRFV